jgi:hypothetical protein
MQILLEAVSTRRSVDKLRGWSVHHAEVALQDADCVEPEVTVLDRDRAVHHWPLRRQWLVDDAAAADLAAERLSAAIRAVGGVAYAVTMPAWLAPTGSLWVMDPDERPADHEEVVVLAIGDRRGREVMVGLVHHRPGARIMPWERVHLGQPEPLLGPLGRALRAPL